MYKLKIITEFEGNGAWKLLRSLKNKISSKITECY